MVRAYVRAAKGHAVVAHYILAADAPSHSLAHGFDGECLTVDAWHSLHGLTQLGDRASISISRAWAQATHGHVRHVDGLPLAMLGA